MYSATKSKLDESYRHIKPYLKDQVELRRMCNHCKNYCGDKHDYATCLKEQCFQFYLAYEYVEWCSSWE